MKDMGLSGRDVMSAWLEHQRLAYPVMIAQKNLALFCHRHVRQQSPPPATTRTGLPQVWASTQKKVWRLVQASFLVRKTGDGERRQIDGRFPTKEEVADNLAGRRPLCQPQVPVSECIDNVGARTRTADHW